ncbi:hypothetical protein [Streptomyces misionensis]
MRRRWKVWCAVVAALALAGWLSAPYVKDRWLLHRACDGALPSGPARQLAAGGAHFTGESTTEHAGLGDYACRLTYSHGVVVGMNAYTGRADQDAVFYSVYPDGGHAVGRPLPQGLPGFVDDFGRLDFLLRCPALGKDAAGRPRRMLVIAFAGSKTRRTSHAVYEAVISLVNSASQHLGCGARRLAVPKGGSGPPQPDHSSRGIAVSEAGGTPCGWVADAPLPKGSWRVRSLMGDAIPAGRCDLTRQDDGSSSTDLSLTAWYGDWSNRLVMELGVRKPLTATARCDGEAANFAVTPWGSEGKVDHAEQRALLRAFAEDQTRRRGCSGLRLTG